MLKEEAETRAINDTSSVEHNEPYFMYHIYFLIIYFYLCDVNRRNYAEMQNRFISNSSENARRGIAILSQAPPILTLSFVLQSREKARVSGSILSENLFERKLEKKDGRCPR